MGGALRCADAVMLAKKGYGPFFLAYLACVSPACGADPPPIASSNASTSIDGARRLGSWTGKGSTTLGFVSESGSFRIAWTTSNEDNAKPGHFHLTLRSGISGRPLKVIADQRGDGSGNTEFGDDPRMYEFLVDAAGVEWAVTVDETFSIRGQTP